MSADRAWSSAMTACMPIAERIVAAQDTLMHLKTQLQSAHASQLAAAATQALPPPSASSEVEAEAEADEEEEAATDAVFLSRSSASASAHVTPLSALPVPALISPQVPALLSQLHSELESLRLLLDSFAPEVRAACFQHVFYPVFVVLKSHPKEVESDAARRAGPRAAGAPTSATTLRAAPFPMLPHQDRVWEAALSCFNSLLQSGVQAPQALRHTPFPKRFLLFFQLLLHFLPSDFTTASSQGGTLPKPSHTPAPTPSLALWHSEETRMQAMHAVHNLFRCCEHIPEAVPLLEPTQRDTFCLSLGYYIHLLLRFASKERNRALRALAIESLTTVVRVLQLPRLNAPDAPLAGRMLLLSYFPGIMSALFNLLIFDSGSAIRSGGWKLQHRAFELFVSLTQAAVRQVASVEAIVAEALAEQRGELNMQQRLEDGMEMRDAHTATADNTLAKLQALVPKTTAGLATPPRPATSASAHSAPPESRSLHPMLQSIMRPIDLAWWSEARKNISQIMARVFAPGAALASHRPLALTMLQAAEAFLLDAPPAESTSAAPNHLDPALTSQGNTIFTALLPHSCTLAWMEFVIAACEHDDADLRCRAQEIVERIGDRAAAAAAGWAHGRSRGQQVGGMVPGAGASSALVPLLTDSLSSHLLRLPRALPTASESDQVALLKTIKGYIGVLGRVASSASASSSSSLSAGAAGGLPPTNVLYDFLSSNLERVLKIFYRIWEVDTRESKLLERSDAQREGTGGTAADADAQMTPADSSTSTALTASSADSALPTYYSFNFVHLHSATAQSLSLSLLRSIGRFSASHWGLLIAHIHERLQASIADLIERGNYAPSNHAKETLLFANCFVLGLADAIEEGRVHTYEVQPHVELLCMEYIGDALWHLPLFNTAKSSRQLTQSELHNNALIVQFLLRGLGDMASALRFDFRNLLMHILYPLLEKMGSNVQSVRQAAWVTLMRVAHACGYDEDERLESGVEQQPSPDRVLQRMLTDNMDYIVEQMSVELRTIQLAAHSTNSSVSASHRPLTLPLVLSSLLTRMSLECTQAIIPLLDDILKVVLDTLGEMSVEHDSYDMDVEGAEAVDARGGGALGSVGRTMSRLAYLEILRAVVRAIHLIQDKQDAVAGVPTLQIDSLYQSAAPLPLPSSLALPQLSAGASTHALLPSAASSAPTSSSSVSSASTTATPSSSSSVSFDPDSFLNFDAPELQQQVVSSSPATNMREEKEGEGQDKDEKEEKEEAGSSEAATSAAQTTAASKGTDVPFFAPSSIRARLQKSFDAKRAHAESALYESEWLRRRQLAASSSGASVSSSLDDPTDDVPRDAEGKTRAERWYEEMEAKRAKDAQDKFNTINGLPLDEEAEANMEREAQAHQDPPEVPLTPDQATSLRIFSQCRNFLSTAPGVGVTRLAQQYTVLCIVSECVPVLERVPKHFFPELAKFWPSLAQALRLMDNSREGQAADRGGPARAHALRIESEAGGGGGFSNSLVQDGGSTSAMRTLTSVRVSDDDEVSSSDRQLTQLISSLSASTTVDRGATPGSASFTHSSASPLFIQALSVLGQLVRGASKFLSGRFSTELWPLLQHIMQFEQRWMQELTQHRRQMRQKRAASTRSASAAPTAAEVAAEDASLSLLPAYKVQLALLQTLAQLVRYPDLSSAHVLSLLDRVGPYLSSTTQPRAFQELARSIYASLALIDPDATWAALWRLCPHVAVKEHERRRAGALAQQATPPQGSFLSHPCFLQAYPNFDARFLLHQRTAHILTAAQTVDGGGEYADNCRELVDFIAGLPEPKLGL